MFLPQATKGDDNNGGTLPQLNHFLHTPRRWKCGSNMPLRSTGCHKCRKRKIRCDERRPSCMRCATHGVDCPGYKTEAGGVEFRDETSQTVNRLNTAGDYGISGAQGRPSKQQQIRTSTPAGYGVLIWKDSAVELGGMVAVGSPRTTTPAPVVERKLYVQRMCSPNANRQAFYGRFMNLYHPHNKSPNERGLWISHLDYMTSLVTMPSCPPALSNGLDALSLIQIGSVYNDRRLRHKAIEAYTKALRSLAVSLSQSANLQDDSVLAAATILSICEFYTEFRIQGQNWISHQQGMQRLIEARGPESLMRSPLAIHLFYQSTSSTLAMSLLIRKGNPYATAMWQTIRAKVAQHDDYSESFRTSLRLPGLLEQHDSLDVTDPEALQIIDRLLVECHDLELEMHEYLANLHANTETNDIWPTLVDIEAFQPFAKLVSDRTMNSAFRFPTFMTAYLYSSHWMRMYLLREIVQSLHRSRTILVRCWKPADHQHVQEQELLCYILNMCRQIPYFIEPGNSAIGEMCCFFPLFVAEMYFRRNSHWRWVEWVHHISDRIFHKGMSMPFVTDRGNVPTDQDGAHYEEQYRFNWLEWAAPQTKQSDDRSASPTETLWTLSAANSASLHHNTIDLTRPG